MIRLTTASDSETLSTVWAGDGGPRVRILLPPAASRGRFERPSNTGHPTELRQTQDASVGSADLGWCLDHLDSRCANRSGDQNSASLSGGGTTGSNRLSSAGESCP